MGVDEVRCFFEITIDSVHQGRIEFKLFNDIAPRTCFNFMKLCEGSDEVGAQTGAKLTYRGSIFHRVIKDFMIQGGDFSHKNGTGGESVFGGVFDDENFIARTDKPYMLCMANRGPNTNGSQFFITTATDSKLADKHIVFGEVIRGQSIVRAIERVKVNSSNCPIADVVIQDCGRLVRKEKKRERERKRSSSVEEINENSKSNKKVEEKQVSSVRPEDLPELPETRNFLYRRSPEKDDRSSSRYNYERRDRYDDAGVKIKGRGVARFRPNESSSELPHWRTESRRIIRQKDAKDIIDRIQKKVEEKQVEKSISPEPEEEEPEPVKELTPPPRRHKKEADNPVADFLRLDSFRQKRKSDNTARHDTKRPRRSISPDHSNRKEDSRKARSPSSSPLPPSKSSQSRGFQRVHSDDKRSPQIKRKASPMNRRTPPRYESSSSPSVSPPRERNTRRRNSPRRKSPQSRPERRSYHRSSSPRRRSASQSPRRYRR